jgi:zinc D-Ala-D-Ala carboxypeptidase
VRSAITLVVLTVVLVACGMPASAESTVTASPAASARAVPVSSPRTLGVGPERLADPARPARPAGPPMTVSYRAGVAADGCLDRDLPALPAADVALTVLDRTYALPASYAPTDLVPAANAGLTGTAGTKLVRAGLLDDLAAMRAGWEAAGLTVIVESAYRSYANQAATFDTWAARLGTAEALVRSARPGHSEHQLGTAIDVTSAGWAGRFGDWAIQTPEGAWMATNAWRYGFVMSYPAGRQDETCFSYEPWHYRWIGREAAAAHRESGLALRTFLERFVVEGTDG